MHAKATLTETGKLVITNFTDEDGKNYLQEEIEYILSTDKR